MQQIGKYDVTSGETIQGYPNSRGGPLHGAEFTPTGSDRLGASVGPRTSSFIRLADHLDADGAMPRGHGHADGVQCAFGRKRTVCAYILVNSVCMSVRTL